ncbi:ParB N-terminal domain-containing protein [Streptomyces sp. CC208A]|uniref:ParB N-terminal domain-containing protein n=1 Tax=Streptomyces sp. CC208A TaxID=3044573 RepID=UPI0024A90B26|nr:ParB N-terminal domain-containing protein [Streptomyces sp. CC208A]
MEITIELDPTNALFPMLDEEGLQALADDIRTHGLLRPVVLDSEGRILDGKNRLRACEIAGVEPAYTTYDGDDPSTFALTVNTQRRSPTKDQLAMIYAMIAAEAGIETALRDEGTAAPVKSRT